MVFGTDMAAEEPDPHSLYITFIVRTMKTYNQTSETSDDHGSRRDSSAIRPMSFPPTLPANQCPTASGFRA